MGKYSQWLQHRETEQQLRAQLAALEQELLQLHERAHLLAQALPSLDNPLLTALLASSVRPSAHAPTNTPETNVGADISEQSSIISPALLAWSQLPNFGPTRIPLEAPQAAGRPSVVSRNSLFAPPDSSSATLPGEPEFPEVQAAEPQGYSDANGSELNDPEGQRTAQLVERWKQRRERLVQPSEEPGNPGSVQHG